MIREEHEHQQFVMSMYLSREDLEYSEELEEDIRDLQYGGRMVEERSSWNQDD